MQKIKLIKNILKLIIKIITFPITKFLGLFKIEFKPDNNFLKIDPVDYCGGDFKHDYKQVYEKPEKK